jgi:hypothetical protein
MTNHPGETISGEKVTTLLRYLIESWHPCKIRIPDSPFCWITILIGIQKEGDSDCLLIDGVPGFEQAFSSYKERGVILEYVDSAGVPCFFDARVVKSFSNPNMIWVEFPQSIYRVQRRKFYRLEAQLGTEVVFVQALSRRRGPKWKTIAWRGWPL